MREGACVWGSEAGAPAHPVLAGERCDWARLDDITVWGHQAAPARAWGSQRGYGAEGLGDPLDVGSGQGEDEEAPWGNAEYGGAECRAGGRAGVWRHRISV